MASVNLTDCGDGAEKLPACWLTQLPGDSYFLVKLFTPKEIYRGGAKNIVAFLARKSRAYGEHGDHIGRSPIGIGLAVYAQRFGMRRYKGRACRIVDAITPIGQGSSSTFYAPTSHWRKSVEANIKRFAKNGVARVCR